MIPLYYLEWNDDRQHVSTSGSTTLCGISLPGSMKAWSHRAFHEVWCPTCNQMFNEEILNGWVQQ